MALERFRTLRDLGSEQTLAAGREALRRLRALAGRLPEQSRAGFLALRPHARALRELGWLEELDSGRAGPPGARGSFEDASLRRLLEVNKRLAQERDPKRLLEFIMDSAVLLTGAERGFLLQRDADSSDGFRIAVARNIDRETLRRGQSKVSTSVAQQVLASGESALTIDAMEDERFRAHLSVHDLRLRSILCVPLRTSDGTDGALYVDNRFRSGAFGEADLAAMEAFADQACLALANARLVAELEASRSELVRSRARVEELNRELARELERATTELAATTATVRRQRRALGERPAYRQIVGDSAAIERVFATIDRLLDNDVPVLVQGESGTGKELVARAIHFAGERKGREFVAVNCGSIPATLIESELFGHVRGAFTGATCEKRGLFEVAHRGTLLLDEVGDMPPEMQVKLLRTLQSGEVQKVGGTQASRVDVRVIAATNRDLKQLVAEGTFREDLYYRLDVVHIRVPPLRERTEDIPLLVQHFIDENRAAGITRVRGARPEVLRLLGRYAWPGNVRELATVVKNATIFAEGELLEPKDLSNFPHVLEATAELAPSASSGEVRPLCDVERDAIVRALRHFGGNKKRTAERLGIDRRTLYNKIAAYGILLETNAKVR